MRLGEGGYAVFQLLVVEALSVSSPSLSARNTQ